MWRLFFVNAVLVFLGIAGAVSVAIAIAPRIPDTEVILFSTFEQSFVFHVLDPYRELSFEIARDLDFNFLYAPSPDGEHIFVRRAEKIDEFIESREGVLNLYTQEFSQSMFARFYSFAAWTSDGRQVVALPSGSSIDNATNYDISYLDMNSGEMEYLFTAPINDVPSAAPNGCCIAYTTFSRVYIYEIATGNVYTVDESLAGDVTFSAPRFSPDSTQILYLAQFYNDREKEIFVYDLSTGENREMTENSSLVMVNPTWSSDGKKIAFVDQAGLTDIYILDVTSGDIRQLMGINERVQILVWVK